MPPDPSDEPTTILTGNWMEAADDLFEHYRIARREDGSLWELGKGAMGVTYKAVDTNLGKFVALKIINAQFLGKETSRKRFRREARTAASLHHRHIAGVYHLGESGGNFFYAMEYVDGETVEARVRRDGPLPWPEALRLTLQVTRALMAAHAKSLVHRDLKPSNIMVVDEVDEQGVARLIDFGLAKSAAEEEGSSNAVTNTSGGFLGTPLYASPEQCKEEPADIRSDIYSLGVTLWFMLTGDPPFVGTLGMVFHQQLFTAPPLEKLSADLPPAVRTLLERMLAKSPDERPQTPTDLRAEIETCLQAPPEAAAPPHSPAQPLPIGPAPERVRTTRLSGETISVSRDTGKAATADTLGDEAAGGSNARAGGGWRGPGRGSVWAVVALVAIAGMAGWFWNQRRNPLTGPTMGATPTPSVAPAVVASVTPAKPIAVVPAPTATPATAISTPPAASPANSQPMAASPPATAVSSATVPSSSQPPKRLPLETKAARAKEYLESALKETESVTDNAVKLSEWSTIAEIQARVGDIEGSHKTSSMVLRAAESLPEDVNKASLLFVTAGAQVKAGDIDGALKTASSITEGIRKAWALGTIAEAQAKRGEREGSRKSFSMALHGTESLPEDSSRARALQGISQSQTKAGDVGGAYKTANGITDGFQKVVALGAIARTQTKAGDLEGSRKSSSMALRVAESIPEGSDKSWALQIIAGAQAMSGDMEGAFKMVSGITDASKKATALQSIAKAQAKTGDVEGAFKTASGITDAYKKAWVLSTIARAQATAGNMEGALKTANGITDNVAEISALGAIAEVQAEAGDVEGSHKSFSMALRVVEGITDGSGKVTALREIVKAQARAGDDPMARRIVATFTPDWVRVMGYTQAANALVASDDELEGY